MALASHDERAIAYEKSICLRSGLFLELHLYFEYHIIDILIDTFEIGIEDSFSCINRRELIEFGQWVVGVVRFLCLYLRHIEVCLAETNTGFSDGNNKKEKAK